MDSVKIITDAHAVLAVLAKVPQDYVIYFDDQALHYNQCRVVIGDTIRVSDLDHQYGGDWFRYDSPDFDTIISVIARLGLIACRDAARDAAPSVNAAKWAVRDGNWLERQTHE
jgi:hypothetical protein